ncbi:MAG: homoserine O-acetyltransferase [Bacteroidetes bacterium]|nr:homoserine O-acetyltransferase [Bacteroidota bacterium]
MSLSKFTYQKRFQLESGQSLPSLEIAYHTFGTLNKERNNVIWVCHALTANSNVFDWWNGLFGDNSLYNPKDHFIVCANNIGSCYGTTGPLSINQETKEAWFNYFPQITIKDIAASLELLKEHLRIDKIHTLIGGSQGGQIAQEWALQNKDLAENLILIATNAQHSPWGIAFNESQRLAIKADRTYYSNTVDAAKKGLSAARSIALLSYRGYNTYDATQKDENYNKTNNYASASYQRYQGEKLANRFNAYSYVRLLDAMDSHNVARNRSETKELALKQIKASTLVIGLTTDILFPLAEQKFLAKNINGANYAEIDSAFGHDGFLIETEKLTKIISVYYAEEKIKKDKLNLQKTNN